MFSLYIDRIKQSCTVHSVYTLFLKFSCTFLIFKTNFDIPSNLLWVYPFLQGLWQYKFFEIQFLTNVDQCWPILTNVLSHPFWKTCDCHRFLYLYTESWKTWKIYTRSLITLLNRVYFGNFLSRLIFHSFKLSQLSSFVNV